MRNVKWNLAACVLGLLVAASAASAATFAVTNLDDGPAAAGPPGSLRRAVYSANQTAGADTIAFNAGLAGTITLTGGQLTLTDSVTITGPGANVVSVGGNPLSFVFWINAGVTAAISGLATENGPGIVNLGTLTLTNCTVSGTNANFGGIYNAGPLTMTGCTVSGNSGFLSGGIVNGGVCGGGFPCPGDGGAVTLTNCTVSGNFGGGISNDHGTVTLTNCTVSGNTAGGGIANFGGTVTLTNTIVANNKVGDIQGAYTDGGHNIVEDGTGITQATSKSGDPLLAPLADNGGPTMTHALLPGSPALDAGDPVTFPATDQRGTARPGAAGCGGTAVPDIGAFEAQRYSVTNLNDSGAGSLRQAVLDNNATGIGGGSICFAPSVTGTIHLTTGTLPLAQYVSIVGPGANSLTISGENTYTVLDITGQAAAIISGLTIANGHTTGSGGAISNRGALALTACTIRDSTAATRGGGIYNNVIFGAPTASVTATDCLFTGNQSALGAAISSRSSLESVLTNVTISGNTCTGSDTGVVEASGGGLIRLESCTVAANTGGGVSANDGDVSYHNTIVAGNTVQQFVASNGGTLTSLGHNLSSDGTGSLTAAGDKPNTDPLLGALADNGGPTQTRALLAGSPAVDAGDCTGGTAATDQRGISRPQGAGCDIGAFELVPPPTTTTLTSSANPAVFGQSVTFTATVAATPPATGTPTGTVTFKDGATTIGTGNLNASGVATLSTSTLAVGNHPITAGYSGSSSFGSSTATLNQTVTQASTTTTLTATPNPSVFGQSVTFTATVAVTAPGAGTPTGTVTFNDGAVTIGTGTLGASGVATLSNSALATGSHSITATYDGDSNFKTSTSSALDQTVGPANTTTTLTAAPNPSVFGQSVTFTATVAVTLPGTGTPTGTVTFKEGAATIGTGTLNASGVATLSASTLALGDHTITATYGGDPNFNASDSASVDQVVNPSDTTTVVTSSVNPSTFGESVTMTATVTAAPPGLGTPTGTVTFSDGPTALGTVTLDATGAATLSTSALVADNHSITADYSGDANFNASTSPPLIQIVDPLSTAVVVTSSLNPSTFGESVTLTATVTAVPPGAGTPTGTVTFSNGPAALGTATLDATGTATLSTGDLTAGNHSITADYSGDANSNPGTSPPLIQIVSPSSTTTALTSPWGSSTLGQSVTFTAMVAASPPGAGTPTGTVTFSDGPAALGTVALDATGVATLSTSALTEGSHSITADYNGDPNFNASTSPALNLTVKPPPVAPVIAAIDDASIQAPNAYTGPTPSLVRGTRPVTWSLAAGPSGMTIDAGTGVVSWPASDPTGSPYTITIEATNRAGSRTQNWQLTVMPAGGAPVIAPIADESIQAPNAYTGPTPSLTQGSPPVTWSLTAGPSGMTIDAGTGLVSWPTSDPAGSPYTITIEAANGDGSGTQNWQLTVTPAPGAPVVEPIVDDSVQAASPYTGPTPSVDPGTGPVTWLLVSGPAGMTIDPATGVVSWPTPDPAGSPYTITIAATDGVNVSGGQTWLLTVTGEAFTLRVLTTNGATAPAPALYAGGTSVQVYAPYAPAGYHFSNWSGDVSGTDNPVSVTMDGDKTITANYVADSASSPPTGPFCGLGAVGAMAVSLLGLMLMRTRRERWS